MLATHKPLMDLTAQDVMGRQVKTIPCGLPLAEAAEMFVHEGITGAPVVDGAGRCVGVLSLADVARWATEKDSIKENDLVPVCPFQVKGRLLTGEEAVICTLTEGCCPLQDARSTTGGRRTLVCRQPHGVLCDWQQVAEKTAMKGLRHYMTTDVVTASPTDSLPALARRMLDAHIHRIVVVDDERRPIGIVSSTDILAAVAYSAAD